MQNLIRKYDQFQLNVSFVPFVAIAIFLLPALIDVDKKWSYGAGGILFPTAEAACQGFVDKEKAPGLKTKIKPTFHSDGSPKPEIKECWYLDKNDNNKETYFSFVYEVDIPDTAPGNDNEPTSPDPCEETAPGPYSNLKDGPGVGKGLPYSPEQKNAVKRENRRKNNGVLRPDDPFDPCYESGLVDAPTGKGLGQVFPKPKKDPCEAQVDHHIPQTDKNGNPCGRNSFNNARLSSFAANNKKSNNPPGGKGAKPPLQP